MHRCALVSVNSGWNLLIGATTDTGAWQPVAVPAECTTVWDEAAKDTCFERAALRGIGRSPAEWLRRAPAKLAVTFDYFGAAPWYLHASNPSEFGERARVALGAVETFVCRLLLLAALVACARAPGPRGLARRVVAFAGAAFALTVHGWLGYAALPAVIGLSGRRAFARGPFVVAATAAVVIETGLVHAVFFGAGRYGLLVAPFVAIIALGSSRAMADSTSCGGGGSGAPFEVSTPLGRSPAAPLGRREESPSSTEHDAG
jgi:hypothetical protein